MSALHSFLQWIGGVAPEDVESERAIENILIAREMVRVDFGADLLIAQPRSS